MTEEPDDGMVAIFEGLASRAESVAEAARMASDRVSMSAALLVGEAPSEARSVVAEPEDVDVSIQAHIGIALERIQTSVATIESEIARL